jgi:hypothetical protein
MKKNLKGILLLIIIFLVIFIPAFMTVGAIDEGTSLNKSTIDKFFIGYFYFLNYPVGTFFDRVFVSSENILFPLYFFFKFILGSLIYSIIVFFFIKLLKNYILFTKNKNAT